MENGLPFWPQILQKLFRIFCFLAAGTIDAKPDKKEKSPQQSEKPANVQAKKQQQQQQQKQQEAAEVMDEDEEKTREAIKSEREAKKLAKSAAKQASKTKTVDGEDDLKPAKVEKQSGEAEETGGKSKAELKAERRAKQEAQRAAKEQQKLQTAVGQWKADEKAPLFTPYLNLQSLYAIIFNGLRPCLVGPRNCHHD